MKRGTIPCTGAGLARFHKWTINFPGPVTGVVLRQRSLFGAHLKSLVYSVKSTRWCTSLDPAPLGFGHSRTSAATEVRQRIDGSSHPAPSVLIPLLVVFAAHLLNYFGCIT